MIKAELKERYIYSENGMKRLGLHEITLETRYFSSEDKYHEWLGTFKKKLWEDDPKKVDLVEGVYVEKQLLNVDDVSEPHRMNVYATFREGTSYNYSL
jgi:hypothetical protein